MSDFWQSAAEWLGHTALAGGTMLGAGWVIARRVADPARKVAAMGWAVRGAVLTAILCALPGWLKLPAPEWAKSESVAVVTKPAVVDTVSTFVRPVETTALEPEPADQWEWVFAEVPTTTERKIEFPKVEQGAVTAYAAAVPAPPPVVPAPKTTGPAGATGDTGIARLLLIVFGLFGGAAVLQLIAGQFALWRLRRTAKPAPEHMRRLFEMFAPPGQKVPTLLVSDKVAFPVCFGLFRPTVLLPRGLARGADGDVLRWVLAHEMDHLRRGDPWTGLWLAVARSCYFFLPWYWAVRKELRLAQEYLADAAAAAAGGSPTEYAAFLVSLTGQPAERRLARHPLGASGVRAKPSDLFRRVHMLVQSGGRIQRTPSKVWSWLTAGGTLGAAVVLSGFGFADDKKPAEKTEVRTVVLDKQGELGEQNIEVAVVTGDDPKTAKRTVTPVADGDEPKVVRLQARVEDGNAKRVEELKKKITEAAKNGDVDAVRKLADELAKAATASSGKTVVLEAEPRKPEAPRAARQPAAPQPPEAPKAAATPRTPPTPRAPVTSPFAAWAPQENLKEAMEKGDAKFKEAMEKMKDNPEAREAMEKAMKEFDKAMEESIRNAPKMPTGGVFGGQLSSGGYGQGQLQFQPMQAFGGGGQMQPFQGGDGKMMVFRSDKPGEGRLGISVEKPNEVLVEQLNLPKGQGVIVVQVVKDSAAEKAGIKAKDVLLTLSGKVVSSEPGDVIKMIGELKNDQKVDVVVIRKGQKETIKGIEIPEGKKVEMRRVEVKPDGKGQFEFTLPKDANIPDDVRKEIEKKIHEAHMQAMKEVERVQRDLPRIQEDARREVERANREVERAARELPKIQNDLQKEIERMRVELRRMEERLDKGGKGDGTSGGKGEGGGKGKSSSSSMQVQTDGETFSIAADRDGVKYEIAGSFDDGKAVAGKVSVKDGDKRYSGTVEKIPAQYRETVKSLMTSVSGKK